MIKDNYVYNWFCLKHTIQCEKLHNFTVNLSLSLYKKYVNLFRSYLMCKLISWNIFCETWLKVIFFLTVCTICHHSQLGNYGKFLSGFFKEEFREVSNFPTICIKLWMNSRSIFQYKEFYFFLHCVITYTQCENYNILLPPFCRKNSVKSSFY